MAKVRRWMYKCIACGHIWTTTAIHDRCIKCKAKALSYKEVGCQAEQRK